MSYMNRMGNAHNRFQGDAKRVLCVCSAGLLRSPTLANVLHEKFGYNTRAVGIADEYALIPVDEVLVEWADEIVFVNQDVYRAFVHKYDTHNVEADMITLDIPDKYGWNAPELRKACLVQYNQYLRQDSE